MNQVTFNNKLSIACVDDDEIYTFLIRKIIVRSEIAHKTTFFHHGRAALDFILKNAEDAEQLPDMMLLDINMPVLDGWQFLEEYENIKSGLAKQIAIFISSSTIDSYDYERGKAFKSISSFVAKPITIEILHNIQAQLHK